MVFLIREVFFPVFFYAILALAAGWAGARWLGVDWAWMAAGGGWAALSALAAVNGVVRYRKTRYQVHGDRIVVHGGGLVSDYEVEVNYPNITHVKWIRPWLSHKWFGVGDVYVEVAGGGSGVIAFVGITGSERVVGEIRRHMGKVFSMSTEQVLHDEQPAVPGIVVDLLLRVAGAMVGLVFLISSGVQPARMLAREVDLERLADFHPVWLLPVALVVVLAVAGLLSLRFFDLKRRNYRVYDGLIEYREGFLTRHDAFIPVENLSNSSVSQRVVERVTNLYNVVVSCKGAGGEVTFLYLRNGPALNAVLDGLIDGGEKSPATSSAAGRDETAVAAEDGPPRGPEDPPPLPGFARGADEPPPLPEHAREPETEHRMHVGRSLPPLALYVFAMPFVLFVAPPVVLLLAFQVVRRVVLILRTRYRLRRNSVQESYAFISTRNREFSNDKLTGVVFRENPLDRLFGTITIEFWSIGDGREIVFRNVRKSGDLLERALRRSRIRADGPVEEEIRPEFSVGRFLSMNLPGLTLLVLMIAGAATAAVTRHWAHGLWLAPLLAWPVLGWMRGCLYQARACLSLYPECMVYRRGILVRATTFARHANIKDVTAVKIPGYDCGVMRFNVAGERRDEGSGRAGPPYGFTMRYVPEITRKGERFDYEVLGRETVADGREPEVVEARKALGNTVVKTLLTGVIVFPLAPLLPVTLPLFVRWASLVRYRIEPGRVLMRKGRLYRAQTSILLDRIDHVSTRQGALNKLFGNGNILISTAGSSSPELVLANVKGHEPFYAELRERHAARDREKKVD